MKLHPYSATLLALSGLILMGVGIYFVFLRPPLLPEDIRYLATSQDAIQAAVPNLLNWLHRVFWVMGGYILSTGLLTLYIAGTSFRTRARGVAFVVALAGATSVGLMSIVNLMINSDFRWPLVGFAAIWGTALALFWLEK